jgi:hypothetical protein
MLLWDETVSYGMLTEEGHIKFHCSSFGCYNKVAMGKSVSYTPISTASIIPPMLHTHWLFCHWCCIICAHTYSTSWDARYYVLLVFSMELKCTNVWYLTQQAPGRYHIYQFITTVPQRTCAVAYVCTYINTQAHTCSCVHTQLTKATPCICLLCPEIPAFCSPFMISSVVFGGHLPLQRYCDPW